MAVATNQPPIIRPRSSHRRHLRDQRQAHRRQHQLAERDHRVGADQPQRRDAEPSADRRRPSPRRPADEYRMKKDSPVRHHADRHLGRRRRLQARAGRATSRTRPAGTSATTTQNGLMALEMMPRHVPVGVVVGPVGQRRAVLVEDHPEDDDDEEDDDQRADALRSRGRRRSGWLAWRARRGCLGRVRRPRRRQPVRPAASTWCLKRPQDRRPRSTMPKRGDGEGGVEAERADHELGVDRRQQAPMLMPM